MRKTGLILLLLFAGINIQAQTDTIRQSSACSKIIVPTALATSALVIMSISGTKESWQPHLQSAIPDIGKFDNILAVTPATIPYIAGLAGNQNRDNFYNRSLILIKAGIIGLGIAEILKYTTHVWRPNGSDHYSFPSGHTTVAFIGAAFTDLELRNTSVIYPIAGYSIAAATGATRIKHNDHWLPDVLFGAATGMAAVWIADALHSERQTPAWMPHFLENAALIPVSNGKSAGFALTFQF
jgi:membrane-associated phospholipid phosphatase